MASLFATRNPLVYHAFAEFVAQLPSSLYIKNPQNLK